MTMTYYLVRHLLDGVTDTIPYRGDNTRSAIRTAIRLHEQGSPASYAQVQDNHGRIIATLSGNQAELSKTKVAWQQDLELHKKPVQLKLQFT